MKRISLLALLALALGLATDAYGQGRTGLARLRSPGGRVEVVFALDGAGAPAYSVSYGGEAIIRPSSLGLVFKDEDGGPLSRGMVVTAVRRLRRAPHAGKVVGRGLSLA